MSLVHARIKPRVLLFRHLRVIGMGRGDDHRAEGTDEIEERKSSWIIGRAKSAWRGLFLAIHDSHMGGRRLAVNACVLRESCEIRPMHSSSRRQSQHSTALKTMASMAF